MNPSRPDLGAAGSAPPGPTGHRNSPPPRPDGSARHAVEQATDRAAARAGEGVAKARAHTASGLDALAQSADAAARQLQGTELGPLSDYVERMGDSLKRLSGDLRQKTGDELLHSVGELARDNPALFVTGGLAIGFGLSRFAKASTEREHGSGEACAVRMPGGQSMAAGELRP